jgi:hypothetical protein
MYTCDGRKFKTLRAAVVYMKAEFKRTGVASFTVEPVVVLNKNPGYIAYLAKGMTL